MYKENTKICLVIAALIVGAGGILGVSIGVAINVWIIFTHSILFPVEALGFGGYGLIAGAGVATAFVIWFLSNESKRASVLARSAIDRAKGLTDA